MKNLLLPMPWVEISIALALVGAFFVSPLKNPIRAWRLGLLFSGAVLLATGVACFNFYFCAWSDLDAGWSLQRWLFEKNLFVVDELNAPLLPMVGLLHFLTALATGRTKMRRFSLDWSLVSESIVLAIFASAEPAAIIFLLFAGTIPAYFELRSRGNPVQVYVLHMALFVVLLIVGWVFVTTEIGMVLLISAILIRCGIAPFHCWLTDWFEHASLGNALLFVTPLVGIYAMARLVIPIAPDWLLQVGAITSLGTAVYAAGMATVQQESRRFLAYVYLSNVSLVLVGLELHTPISLTGALSLWIAVALSLAGFGLTLRAMEARFGRLTLTRFHGLYDHTPLLAACFLLTGLASVGFPGTVGFVAGELLADEAVEAGWFVGLAVALASALNGIAVIRAYFLIFKGARHVSTVSLGIGMRERIAVLTLAALLLGGSLFPQPGIASRHQAALAILQEREDHFAGQKSSPGRAHERSQGL